MPARALLVLLVMLNFGVATWWLLSPGPSPAAPWKPPEGVPRLQLLAEAPPRAASTEPRMAAPAAGASGMPGAGAGETDEGDSSEGRQEPADAASPAPPDASAAGATDAEASRIRCYSFGPFEDVASVAVARGALQPLGAARLRVRDAVESPRGWRVVMPPLSDRAAADALAGQIRQAGFDDLLVVSSGEEANSIALGRYGSETAARRRESALRGAGFPVLVQPLEDASTRHWLDAATGPGFDPEAARREAGARQATRVDCAAIVEEGAAG